MVGDIIHLRKKPVQLKLGDRKENLKKIFEPIERKEKEVEHLKNGIKKR